MNLKTLAAVVCIASILQLALSLYNAISWHSLTPMYAIQATLNIPMILFFFFVWRRQKQ